MPYGCANCPFVSGPVYDSNGKATYFCKVDVEGVRGNVVTTEVIALYEGATEAFPRFCPLVEVPTPHGRLGDLDKLWDRMYNYIDNEGAKMPFGDNDFMIHRDSACELVEDTHTIIEAEGSDT